MTDDTKIIKVTATIQIKVPKWSCEKIKEYIGSFLVSWKFIGRNSVNCWNIKVEDIEDFNMEEKYCHDIIIEEDEKEEEKYYKGFGY